MLAKEGEPEVTDLCRTDVGWSKDVCVVTALGQTRKKASGLIATKQKVMTPPANEDKRGAMWG